MANGAGRGRSGSIMVRTLALVGLLAAAFAVTYSKVLAALVREWWASEAYSYGFLIPGISVWLVWARRHALAALQAAPSYAGGVPVLLCALLLLLLGQAGSLVVFQELSLVAAVAGAVLLVLGRPFLRLLRLPIAYLLLMIPIWHFVFDRAQYPLQMLSATLGTLFLRLLGIPAHQHGPYIDLPSLTLEVAEACSGMRYLIGVVAIGIPMADLFLRGWRRRTALLALGVGVAIGANGLRIALIGVLDSHGVNLGDPKGPSHLLQGLYTAIAGYAALLTGLWLLSRGQAAQAPPEPVAGSLGPRGTPPVDRRLPAAAATLCALLVLAGSAIPFHTPAAVALARDLEALPVELAAWSGRDAAPPEAFRALGADRDLARIYRRASGETVRLYVGYFALQQQGRELVSWRSFDLFHGASPYEVETPGGPIVVGRLVEWGDTGGTLTLFWYDLNDRVVPSAYRAKLYTAWDALVHRRTNGAIVVITTDVSAPADLERSLAAATGFVQDLLPQLQPLLRQRLQATGKGAARWSG